MTLPDRLSVFSPLDGAALVLLVLCWFLTGWRIEHPGARQPSVSVLMESFRREWMVHMITRQPRIFDAQLLSSLRQGASFLASATMIALGGGFALIGKTDELAGLARDLTLGTSPTVVWEIKILTAMLFLTNAFLKFVWSHRLFGYCAIMMAAVPNDESDPLALPRAVQSAELNITAARSFNRGLRATYFALAATAWLIGAAPLIAATLVCVAVLWRREFASQSRRILMQTPASAQPDL